MVLHTLWHQCAVLAAIDVQFVVAHHLELVCLFFACLAVVASLSFFLFFHFSAPICAVHTSEPRSLPKRLVSPQDVERIDLQLLVDCFGSPINGSLRHPKRKKKLIIIEIESLGQQTLVRFNALFPRTVPCLSNLSEQYTFADHIVSNP
jgi:hypothetical protein